MTGFDPAAYERELDETSAGVMPDSWDGHRRLEEGDYPYRNWPASDIEGGFHFSQA